MQIAAVVFEIGGGATHGGDESLEEVGNGIADIDPFESVLLGLPPKRDN